jgi:hypothetical protein
MCCRRGRVLILVTFCAEEGVMEVFVGSKKREDVALTRSTPNFREPIVMTLSLVSPILSLEGGGVI